MTAERSPKPSLPEATEVLARLDSFTPRKKADPSAVNKGREKLRRQRLSPQDRKSNTPKRRRVEGESWKPRKDFTPVIATTTKSGRISFKEREDLDDPRVTDVIVESLMPSDRVALAILYGTNIGNRISAGTIKSFMNANSITMDYHIQIQGMVRAINEITLPHGLKIETFFEGEGNFESYYLASGINDMKSGGFIVEK